MKSDNENDSENESVDTYEFERLDNDISSVFSSFEERRWIINLNGIEDASEIKKILIKLGWIDKRGIFISPSPDKIGQESSYVRDLLKSLKECKIVYKDLNLYCAIGSINLEKIK